MLQDSWAGYESFWNVRIPIRFLLCQFSAYVSRESQDTSGIEDGRCTFIPS